MTGFSLLPCLPLKRPGSPTDRQTLCPPAWDSDRKRISGSSTAMHSRSNGNPRCSLSPGEPPSAQEIPGWARFLFHLNVTQDKATLRIPWPRLERDCMQGTERSSSQTLFPRTWNAQAGDTPLPLPFWTPRAQTGLTGFPFSAYFH